MTEALLASYEEVPYESKPISASHPDCLATMATLHGMKPPLLETCRVLELGCAGGGNLIPMALTLPDAHFVGIDLSPRQIAEGQEVVAALGIRNLNLQPLSILDVGRDFGAFDYILTHGVYSWVPAEVQEKILAICRDHLAPDGVAYISYNTYPGWHLRGMVREMLIFHVQRHEDPRSRVREARAFLDFLSEAVGASRTTYGQFIKEEADLLRPQTDSYFFHEQLESYNEPLYFWQFAERAAAKDLQYLCEARLGSLDGEQPAELEAALQQFTSDPLRREQYLDFLRLRTFRRTLLCHASIRKNTAPLPEQVPQLRAVSYLRPATVNGDLTSEAVVEFRNSEGASVSVKNPLVKVALSCLGDAAPLSVTFDELVRRVRERLPVGDVDRRALAEMLLHGLTNKLVELHVSQPPLVASVSARPVACPLARFQAAHSVPRIANRWHRLVELGPLERLVLTLLDGSRDRARLLEALVDQAVRGVLLIQQDGQPLRDAKRLRPALEAALDPGLRRLAGAGLLIG